MLRRFIMMALTKKKKLTIMTTFLSCLFFYQNSYNANVVEVATNNVTDTKKHELIFQQLRLNFYVKSIYLQIFDKSGDVVFDAIIGTQLSIPFQFKITKNNNNDLILLFDSSTSLHISTKELRNDDTVKCYNIHWSKHSQDGNKDFSFHDKIHIVNSYWYGGALMRESYWPINNKTHILAPFVTGNSYRNDYGSIQERFWLSSSGLSIFVEYDVPLFVDINHLNPGWMAFVSKNKKPYKMKNSKPLILHYTLCTSSFRSPKQVFLTAARNFWRRPVGIPNIELFKYPTWSTWASFKRSISSEVVLKYASEIVFYGFNSSQLIIDDGWMTHYGDFEFNSYLFPNPKHLILKLKELFNSTVSLWIHPFASCFSFSFWKRDSLGKSIWVRSFFDWLPSQIIWWNGIGSLLDLTNQEASAWYLSELERIQTTYGVDSFKFDAGESIWLPDGGSMLEDFSSPNDYTKLFSNIAYASDYNNQRLHEVRSLVSSQYLPTFVRLIDKNSDWSGDNGILSIIPQTLTVGLIGYPFVFPDMIGGNGYFGIFIHFTILPERELYIRWLQLSALMPTMQFSIPPWSYDDEVIQIAQDMTYLHKRYSNLIIKLAEEAMVTGAPIIRPIWWNINYFKAGLDAYNRELFTCETEFLLGDDILVAPVLEKGARSRTVYFPNGTWVRGNYNGTLFEGNAWHTVEIALEHLAYFIRVL